MVNREALRLLQSMISLPQQKVGRPLKSATAELDSGPGLCKGEAARRKAYGSVLCKAGRPSGCWRLMSSRGGWAAAGQRLGSLGGSVNGPLLLFVLAGWRADRTLCECRRREGGRERVEWGAEGGDGCLSKLSSTVVVVVVIC